MTLVNGGRTPLEDIWCVAHLPPEFMTRRHTFCVERIEAGGRFERTIPVGAGSHYLPRAVGNAPYTGLCPRDVYPHGLVVKCATQPGQP